MTEQTITEPVNGLATVAHSLLAEEAATRNPEVVSAGARFPQANLATPMNLNVPLVNILHNAIKLNPLAVKPAPPPPPPPPHPPWVANWNPITFSNAPVGGWATVTIYPDGNWNFSGGLHDSGFPSFSDQVAYIFTASNGAAFSFSRSGEMYGTLQSGSRDDNWTLTSNGTPNAALAEAFGALNGWHASASVNWDPEALLKAVEQAAQVVGQVIAVVGEIA